MNLCRGSAVFAALVMLTGLPSRAGAHLVSTGMGPVYDGIGHLLLTPEDLIPVIALALYAGLRGAASGRRAMFLLPIAWFFGGLAGAAANVTATVPLTALSFILFGALVAVDLSLPPAAVAALAAILGLVHGFLNGAALRDNAGALGLVGIMAVLFVLVALVSAGIVSMKRPWARVAVRVAGSWVAAIGLLMFGWSLK